MAKINPNHEDGPTEDHNLYVAAHVDNNDRMMDAYIAGISICSMRGHL